MDAYTKAHYKSILEQCVNHETVDESGKTPTGEPEFNDETMYTYHDCLDKEDNFTVDDFRKK